MLVFAESLVRYALSLPQIIFVVGGLIAIIAIVFGTLNSVFVARAREQTKREIAAYVAEGPIDADNAVEMLKVGGVACEDE
jgi:hypothetical protein